MDEFLNLESIVFDKNNRPNEVFEGYSPTEMHSILYSTFDVNCPVRLIKLNQSGYNQIPILNQIKYIIKIIESAGELKLTKLGFFTTKVVADIYSQGLMKDRLIERGISKLYKETDSMSINLSRILIELSGLTKKRHNKLSLTKKGKLIIGDDYNLLMLIFKTFAQKFNWAYYDGYGDFSIGQIGFGFTLILLKKYGATKRIDSFYSDKYFKAFPHELQNIPHSRYGQSDTRGARCFSLRSFDRFLELFGLIQIESKDRIFSAKYITKTTLFDKLIKIEPHKKVINPFVGTSLN